MGRRQGVVAKAKAKASVATPLLGADSSESEDDLLRGAMAAVQAQSEQPTNAGVCSDSAVTAAAARAQPQPGLESRRSADAANGPTGVDGDSGRAGDGVDGEGFGYLEALEADLWEIIQADGALGEFREVVAMVEAAAEDSATAAATAQQNEQRQDREAEEAAEQQEVEASAVEPVVAMASAPALAADAVAPSPAVPRADLRSNAVELRSDVVDPTLARHMLGIEKVAGSKLFAETLDDQSAKRYLGKFYTIGGKTLQCVCAHGGSCKVMFNYKRSSQSDLAEAKCTLWLATGMHMSRDEHARMIPDFRASVRAQIAGHV